jgi:murein DD-endopeptidase MepM/ murein hydrolase activator NlpD
MTRQLLLPALVLGLGCSDAVEAQAPRIEVWWEPDQPVQGRLFEVVVWAERAEDLVSLRAELAGQPLHFRERTPGIYTAVAATPIDASGELVMPVLGRWAGGAADSVAMAVPIAEGDYRLERLTVAPQFGRPQPPEIQDRIRREGERAREVSRRSHDTPRLWEGPAVHPRPTRITSGFGHGREFNGEVTGRHMGTDFAGAVGAPVHAPVRGVVALVDDFFLGGRVIYLDHGEGLVTGYLHLSEQLVVEGDTVEAGQLIGRVGATGRVTGPHLHWLVRYGTITVDPLSFLEIAEPREHAPRHLEPEPGLESEPTNSTSAVSRPRSVRRAAAR